MVIVQNLDNRIHRIRGRTGAVCREWSQVCVQVDLRKLCGVSGKSECAVVLDTGYTLVCLLDERKCFWKRAREGEKEKACQ